MILSHSLQKEPLLMNLFAWLIKKEKSILWEKLTSCVHFKFRKHDLLLNTMKKKIREKKMHKTRSNSQVMYVYVWKNNDIT